MKDKVTIIGAGLMGHGICQVFTLAGHETWMYDAFPDSLSRGLDGLNKNLTLAVAAGYITPTEAEAAKDLAKTEPILEKAVDGAGIVFECAPEKMELKQEIFLNLDKICSRETILASNTSVMSITEIAAKSSGRDRIIGTHFWNPPHLIPLVEVVQTVDTATEVIDRTMAYLNGANKKPIHVKKDVPGFVANRMQHALWREAFHILDEGICDDAATIDVAVRNSFGLRLPQLGPLENADMVGLDLTFDIHEYILKHLANNSEPSRILCEKVAKGEFGFKTQGHGLREWSPEAMDDSRRKLSEYLMHEAIKNKSSKRCYPNG